MNEHDIGSAAQGASPAAEPKPNRYTRWSRIKIDLPDAPEAILDDLFWTSVNYFKPGSQKDFQPETYRYLGERGFCGILWP
jgi:hypothetical protein